MSELSESRSTGTPLAAILLYHRVADDAVDAFGNRVTPANFASHLEVLCEEFHPVRLRDLADPGARQRLPGRAVAVTFDDGYADNLHTARPLLNRYAVPATVFVATAALGGAREFWWDRLERLLLGTPRLERRLQVELGGKLYETDLFGWELYEAAAWPEHAGWTAYGDPDPTPRHRALRELWQTLRLLPEAARLEAIDRIAMWAGAVEWPPARCLMTASEVTELASDDLFDIGAHTVSHPSLASLGPEMQWQEIANSRRALEALLGREVAHFAYPFGQSLDYDAATVELVHRAGFTVACTARAAAFEAKTPVLELPRISVWNHDGAALASTLEEYFQDPLPATPARGGPPKAIARSLLE